MTKDFEVIDIKDEQHRFIVEIEFLVTRERKEFGYPKGNGWMQEIDGEPKFLRDIKRKVADMEQRANESIEEAKKKVKGCKVCFDDKHPEGKAELKKK